MASRVWLAIDIGLKVALIGLLLLAVLFPHFPQFEGKAMGGRALVYPLAAFLVPAVWFIWFRRYWLGLPVINSCKSWCAFLGLCKFAGGERSWRP